MVKHLFVFFLFTIHSFSQQIKFENFTTNQGLSNNSVVDIKNDKDGGLWIATWDGLNYFDGYKFKIFKNDSNDSKTISSNYIIKLEKDRSGQLWLITKEGNINRYIGNEKFEEFKFKSIPTNIHLSYKGNIVVETNSAYYEFKNKSFVEISESFVKKTDFQNLKNILLKKYPKLTINEVLKDKSGNIWFATRENGLYIMTNESNENSIEHFTTDLYDTYSFKSNEIESIHEDDFGNIWLGLKDGGLSMAYKGSEKINSVTSHPIKDPNLPTETIRAVTKDNEGKTWLGYYSKGLFYYNNKTRFFEKFQINEASSNADWDRVRSLFTASDGTIWAGTYKGILRISGNQYKCFEAGKTQALPNNRCYSFYEDKNKQLWVSCWGGLAKFNLISGKFESFKGQQLLSKFHIRCVKKDNQNLIIATENNGIILFNLVTNTIKQITTKNGILGNSTYSVLLDKESDNYWIASLGGVSVFNKKKGVIKNLTEENGLPSHMVYGLLDNSDKIWISTTKGIASIDKKNYTITAYNPNYGWQAIEFSEGAYYQDTKGTLFFGGVRGLNYFNPNNLQSPISNIKLKLKIDGNENYLSEIEKSFTDNDLEIEIIPIRFPNSNKNKIYYKLEGNDENWILLTADKKIKYTGLSSGDYKLLVKEGKYGKIQSTFFKLHISNAFYETIWFYIILLGLTVLIGSVLINLKNKAAASQKKYLEELVAERTAEIRNKKKNLQEINEVLDQKNKKIAEQKEKLLLLHSNFKDQNFEIEKFKSFMLAEFQDPINKIIKASSTLKKDTETQRELAVQSRRLINLISEWNYLEHVKELGPVKKAAVYLFPILKQNIEKFKKDLQLGQVNFNGNIDNSSCYAAIDVLRLKLLLQYFFNDFSKYSDADSTLDVTVSYVADSLEIKVISDSIILKNNWFNILHYSPYFKALQVLLEDLNGEIIPSVGEEFQTTLKIPLEIIDTEINRRETISWKNFNYQEQFSSTKQYLLVFSEESDQSSANQILENSNYNLVFESSVSNLNAILKQMDIEVLVFYQATFSKELIQFLKSNKESNNLNIPMIYISEEINYELNEQLLEIGIDTHIQLPASSSFISKKIDRLIDQNNETQEENKLQQKVFEILTDEDDITTSNEKLFKKALEIIRTHLHDPSFNVEVLVEKLEISRVKCYRLFKENLNQSPSDILMSLRLQKAEVLLKTKKLNISEISFECGYNDPKYFGRSFKKYFGKSPKEYKEYSV